MKTIGSVICVLAICAFAISPAVAETPEEFLEKWASAIEDEDVEGVVACYENSESVMAIQSYGVRWFGIDEIRKEYKLAFDDADFFSVKLKDLEFRTTDGLALGTCELKALMKGRADGLMWIINVYTTFLLRRSGNTWEIVFDQSTPIMGIPRVQPVE